MATVVRENIAPLNDKLTVKISKDDYFPSFEKKLKEYSKTANIPGFRKGMVPAGMIKKMYGAGIFNDEVLRTVEKELYNWLNTEKPEIFAQPLPLTNDLNGLDMNKPSDVEFGFEIGLKPTFELPALDKAPLINHKVEVTDAMVNEEIDRMQIKGGKMTEPEAIDNEENVLTVLFTETDKDGNAVEGGISKENSVLVKYMAPKIQKEVMGKKAGDHFVFQLNKVFEGDKLEMMLQDLGFAKDDQEAAKKFFKLDVVKVGLVEKRELNEEFFNEIFPGKGITTEDALRAELKKEIEAYWASQSLNQLHDQLYHYLLDETKMEFPENFLKRWLETGGEKPKTADEAAAEYPTFSNQLKWTLISDKLITDNKMEVTEQELRDSMQAEVMRYFGQMNMGDDTSWLDSYIDRMMKDEKQVDATYRRLITEKVFSYAASQTKPKEKKVTAEELVAMQHNHQH
ncbi:MAG: trigger factor [Chitinophagaceae bacterium]|nr:MAG: trigger factor [Chitinophagaceae bacterium]